MIHHPEWLRRESAFGSTHNMFIKSSMTQQQEWDPLSLGSKGTTLLRKHYENNSVEKIIQNYSFKDSISQKIFSSTITKPNDTQTQDSQAPDNQIDELISKYTDLIQNITDSPKTKEEVGVLEVSKHFPNIMDKRHYQIKQLFWSIVAKANRSVHYSPLRPRKESNFNETQSFFYLRSFLSPRVIEHLPEATFLDVISEVKCLQFPNRVGINPFSNDDLRESVQSQQYTDFTWELVHWLLLVMKHFEGKNDEILKECSQGLNHLCSQTSDALAHYLMIQDLLKTEQITDRAKQGIENLKQAFKQTQGPRDYFPYCMLDGNYFADSGF